MGDLKGGYVLSVFLSLLQLCTAPRLVMIVNLLSLSLRPIAADSNLLVYPFAIQFVLKLAANKVASIDIAKGIQAFATGSLGRHACAKASFSRSAAGRSKTTQSFVFCQPGHAFLADLVIATVVCGTVCVGFQLFVDKGVNVQSPRC